MMCQRRVALSCVRSRRCSRLVRVGLLLFDEPSKYWQVAWAQSRAEGDPPSPAAQLECDEGRQDKSSDMCLRPTQLCSSAMKAAKTSRVTCA
jgi:hypothetical protein